MIIKMRSNNIAVHIICRVLNRCKFLNIPSDGKNNNSSRMLSCGTSYPCTALHNSVDFAITLSLSTFFIIVLDITKSCFLCQRTDCSRLKCLPRTENNLNVTVRFSLIITGKVQVNIRLFISFKSKEGFKRNIKSFFYQRLSAYRTFLIWHIASCPSRICPHLLGVEICVVTFGTIIMWT